MIPFSNQQSLIIVSHSLSSSSVISSFLFKYELYISFICSIICSFSSSNSCFSFFLHFFILFLFLLYLLPNFLTFGNSAISSSVNESLFFFGLAFIFFVDCKFISSFNSSSKRLYSSSHSFYR